MCIVINQCLKSSLMKECLNNICKVETNQSKWKAILMITPLLLKHNRLLGIPNWNFFLPQSHPELAKGKEAIRRTKHNQFPQGHWLFLILLLSSSTIHLEITGIADMVVNTDILLQLCLDIQCLRATCKATRRWRTKRSPFSCGLIDCTCGSDTETLKKHQLWKLPKDEKLKVQYEH